jgi:hypothetical protein
VLRSPGQCALSADADLAIGLDLGTPGVDAVRLALSFVPDPTCGMSLQMRLQRPHGADAPLRALP